MLVSYLTYNQQPRQLKRKKCHNWCILQVEDSSVARLRINRECNIDPAIHIILGIINHPIVEAQTTLFKFSFRNDMGSLNNTSEIMKCMYIVSSIEQIQGPKS